jgi:coatomer protein complex subunit alpha (xenin)
VLKGIFAVQNFINAAGFAKRLLELPEMSSEKNAEARSKAQKVMQKSLKEGRNEYPIDYDEMNPFTLDCDTLKPIYKGSPSVKCAYCSSTYAPAYKGKLCQTCNISQVCYFTGYQLFEFVRSFVIV